jgi:hypothetical protein
LRSACHPDSESRAGTHEKCSAYLAGRDLRGHKTQIGEAKEGKDQSKTAGVLQQLEIGPLIDRETDPVKRVVPSIKKKAHSRKGVPFQCGIKSPITSFQSFSQKGLLASPQPSRR